MSERRFGWRKDPPKPIGTHPDYDARHLLAAAPPPPPAADNRNLIMDVLDQGPLGSCVANAAAQALRAAMARELATISGVVAAPPALPSRLWIYWFARSYTHETALDDGTFLRLAFQAIVELGFPPETAWPYLTTDERFKTRPGLDAMRLAFDQRKPTVYRRIFDTGAARVDAVKRALAAGYLVTFGTLVSEAFAAGEFDPAAPLGPPAPSEPIAGGHALTMVGYDTAGIKVVNSWGTEWGDGGYWEMAPTYLTWEQTDDLWIVERTATFGAQPGTAVNP